MKKIGFIDYYLDEWHANTYPARIEALSGGKMKVTYAYGKIDKPDSELTNDKWCEKYGVQKLDTIEELVEKSDFIVVLSPDNPEFHEELSYAALCSGKPTFIDKTFSPDKDGAVRMMELAELHKTPCYSTSALRFADEYKAVDTSSITAISSWGPMPIDFDSYSIHQFEPLMMLMNSSAKRVIGMKNDNYASVSIELEDGRNATLSCYDNNSPFMMNIGSKNSGAQIVKIDSDFFENFFKELIRFFETGISPVSASETIKIMAVRYAAIKALKNPGVWVNV